MSETELPLQPEFVDANVIVRYLVADVPDLADRAANLIDSDRDLTVSVLVLAEAGFVLTRVYGINRERVVDTLVSFLNRENISVHEVGTDAAIQALYLCRPSNRVSFVDALLWAVVRSSGGSLWTYDNCFPAAGVVVRQP